MYGHRFVWLKTTRRHLVAACTRFTNMFVNNPFGHNWKRVWSSIVELCTRIHFICPYPRHRHTRNHYVSLIFGCVDEFVRKVVHVFLSIIYFYSLCVWMSNFALFIFKDELIANLLHQITPITLALQFNFLEFTLC